MKTITKCKKAIILVLVSLLSFLSIPKINATITKATPFVEAKDGNFYIGEDEFRFVGTNNYYLHYKDKAMVDAVLNDASTAGFNVIRMWAFLDGAGSSVVENKAYMQSAQGYYDTPSWASYDFINGFDQMDYAVSQAAKKDIRLILVFTNYWNDFGGINEYVTWYNQKHGYTKINPNYLEKKDFYTNEEVKGYYKDYVSYIINRTNQYNGRKYIEDPTIFAWELMNEPRNPTNYGGNIDDVTQWADEMSKYVKSIDANHMVCLGDEGSFNNRGDWDYESQAQHIYDGSEGVDFEAVLSLEAIDFGTYHLYPESWGINHSHLEWGEKFIIDHINVGKRIGKPVILEEFGINANLKRNRELIYTRWLDTVYEHGGAGALFWMYASIDTSEKAVDGGYYPDYDGFRLAEIQGKYPELEVLKTYAKLFSGQIIDFADKIYVISPYTVTNFLEIESDLYDNQMYPIKLQIRTLKKINKVEMYLDGELYTTLKYNKITNTYETMFNMRHIYRGSNVDLKFVAYTPTNMIESNNIEIRRLLKFDYFIDVLYDFNEAYQPFDVQFAHYGSPYNAEFYSVSWSEFNGGATKVSLNHHKDYFWSEVKLEVINLPKATLQSNFGLSYDVYYEKSKLTEGVLRPTDEAYETAPGFRHYAAIDPGWMKIGLNENNVKYFDLEEVTIDGVVYLKQNVNIRYNATVNHTKLVVGIVTNHLLYQGDVYIDNLTFYSRSASSEVLAEDDYIDWYMEQEAKLKKAQTIKLVFLITGISFGILLTAGTTTIILLKRKRKS